MKKQYLLQLAFILLACMPSFAKDVQSEVQSGSTDAIQSITSFIENKGQITDQYGSIRQDIQFKLNGTNGLNLFIGNGAIHYQWSQAKKEQLPQPDNDSHSIDDKPIDFAMYRMDVELIGCNKNAEVVASDINDYYEMYYTPTTGINGSRAHTFSKLTYIDIYPNIDWVLYTKNAGLKHEFVVKDGGNAKDIQIKYKGATNLKINTDGSLTATTPMGVITEAAPVSFTNEQINVASSYVLNENIVSYNLGSYIGNLTIDPEIEWGGYYAGLSNDYFYASTTNSTGINYICGHTYSNSNIVSSGAHDASYSSGADGMIVSIRKDGSRAWGTYYGNTGNDFLRGLALKSNGDLFVVGYTSSTYGLITGGPGNSGGYDGLIIKMTSSGSRSYCRYFGGSGDDRFRGCSISQSGDLFVVGQTTSGGLATNGAQIHQNIYGGGTDGILVLCSSNNGAESMATYFGGNASDYLYKVATDNNGNAIICGKTISSNNIASSGSHQSSKSGVDDGVLASFTSNGVMNWSTYYGGSGYDYINNLTLDQANNIYIVGQAQATTNIATSGTYQTTNSGNYDGFIAKFNNSGVRQWGTYYGGSGSDKLHGIAINSNGDILVCGETESNSGIATNDAPIPNHAGKSDAILASFSSTGNINWGTYYGGSEDEVAWSIGVDAVGSIYITGETISKSGIATPGTLISTYVSGYYGFITKFCNNPIIDIQPVNIAAEAGESVKFSISGTGGDLTYQWQTDLGTGFQNITNSGQYSGAQTATLTISNITVSNNNQKFKCVLTSGACELSSFERSLSVFPTSINSLYSNNVSVYPNPVKDQLTITADMSIEKAAVYSITGRMLKSILNSSPTLQIDMAELTPGIYIIKINDEHVTRVTKQ